MQGKLFCGVAIQMFTNDLMTALEEKNGLEFLYRERFAKPAKHLGDMDADQELIEQLKNQFSINPDLIDKIHDENSDNSGSKGTGTRTGTRYHR
jgi:hypothetical protein